MCFQNNITAVRFLFLFQFLTLFAFAKRDSILLSSPDKLLSLTLFLDPGKDQWIQYQISSKKRTLIPLSSIGISTAAISAENSQWKVFNRSSHSSEWRPIYGERKIIADAYNQVQILFTSSGNVNIRLLVDCRIYNEGFAFRYRLFNLNQEIIIDKETSQFQFPQQSVAWASSTAQGVIEKKWLSELGENIERPLTIRIENDLYVSIGEAALVDYPRMKLRSGNPGGLTTQLFEKASARDSIVSPWRFILIGNSPGELLTKNYFVQNLNEPSAIQNPSWIKPGKVLRETTLTTVGAFRAIDFASARKIEYVSFDAGWYGREDHDSSDAKRVSVDPLRSKGPLNLPEVIAYANRKDIGIILYVNRRSLERQLDTLLPLYQSWGIKGLKFGFVQVGAQHWTNWLHESVRRAAKYKMIVDIHDEYRPTGYSRTYPNLLTQEGIRGDEETIPVSHSITTLFTRMIAGAADNTFCYFTKRVDKMGSHAAQLAKSVCIYSPLQFIYWYDRPGDKNSTTQEAIISEEPELKWFDDLPVSWEDTRVIESDMEGHATIARKRGSEWWLGSLCGSSPRELRLKCSFLDARKQYEAIIYSDQPSMNTRTNVYISRRLVTHDSSLRFQIPAQNGIAIRFVPLRK